MWTAAREMLNSRDMRFICAMCAIALVALPGCFVSHGDEATPPRPTPTPGLADAAVAVTDAGWITIEDSGRDAGFFSPPAPSALCREYWTTLQWCPSVLEDAVGQPCESEGMGCGSDCCEPGPPIACLDGVWRAIDTTPGCSGVRCAAPIPCGRGVCTIGQVCVQLEGLRGGDSGDDARCVIPATPIASCDDAPSGSLVSEPGGCFECHCAMVDGRVQISLDCPCC